jgi:hypothetical protein
MTAPVWQKLDTSRDNRAPGPAQVLGLTLHDHATFSVDAAENVAS